MAFQTLNQLKLQLSIASTTDDALLTELQRAAEAFIQTHCQRDFTGSTFTEYHRSGTKYLFARRFPIHLVQSVQLDPERQFGPATTLDPSDYVVLPDVGLIESLSRGFLNVAYPNAVKIVYSTLSSVPAEILRAEAELVGHWYRQQKTQIATEQLNLISRADGTISTEYPWGQSGGYRLPAGVLQLLKSHRVPAI